MPDIATEEQPTGKRWEPIGASNDSCDRFLQLYKFEGSKLINLEKDKEFLSSSLFAITTHFAQVQFRLRQVIHASPETKQELLESLEEFACQGIPDVEMIKESRDEVSLMKEIQIKRHQETQLFSELKNQFMQLEYYAFKNTNTISYDTVLLQRYRAIINELKTKIKLQINDERLNIMRTDDINIEVNMAIEQLVAPLKIKEALVNQLKCQISDLENFIQFLQTSRRPSYNTTETQETLSASRILYKLANAVEIFAFIQFGCLNKQFQRQKYKCPEMQDYRPLQDKFKESVDEVRILIDQNNKAIKFVKDTLQNHHETDLAQLIRTSVVMALKELIEHGTCCASKTSVIPFVTCCLPISVTPCLCAWDIFLKYYELQTKLSPNVMFAMTLLKSFDLDTSQNSPREELLWCIKTINSVYEPYKINTNYHFTDLICTGLNSGKLVPWLSLMFANKQLIKECYQPWSYVTLTEFQDTLEILDTLRKYRFDLPVNIAVERFQNIKDVFY